MIKPVFKIPLHKIKIIKSKILLNYSFQPNNHNIHLNYFHSLSVRPVSMHTDNNQGRSE